MVAIVKDSVIRVQSSTNECMTEIFLVSKNDEDQAKRY